MADIDPVPDPNEPPAPEPELSLAEHEAQFGSADQRPQPDPNPEPEEDIRRAPRERDDQGKFVKPEKEKPANRRPASHEAPAAEVRSGRIDTLTKNWRTAEAERDALRAEVDRLKAQPAAPVPRPAVAAKPETAPPAAAVKPKIDQFQDYDAYVEALADWKIGEARRQDRETAAKDAETARIHTNWRNQVEAAKAKYPDFEQVALQAPTRIPQGSLIDAWILEHRTGADVLYTLQSNPAELDRILSLPLFDQVEALTLLGQRTGQPPRAPAASTGAAAPVPIRVAPRPPTPVRTSAVSALDEPPDYENEDVSLAAHEKWFGRKRS